VDLGCGPGTDAATLVALGHAVVALDASPAMVARAQARGVDARVMDLRALGPGGPSLGSFDGAISDFGALNCLDSLERMGAWLRGAVRAGGVVAVVVMGRMDPAEWAWLWTRQRGSRRRDGPVKIGEAEVMVRYLDAGRVTRELGPGFREVHHEALGLLWPSPDLAAGDSPFRHVEPRLASLPVLRHLGDHHLLIYERT
jgi:SAM-dependent methyltransferase